MRILLLFLLATSALAAEAIPKLQRLDPHGTPELGLRDIKGLRGHSECTVCHIEADGKIQVRANPESTCRGCHSPFPHGGAAEHLGRKFEGAAIHCLTCHSAHRAEGRAWESPGGFFSRADRKQRVSTRMLKRTCSECHKW